VGWNADADGALEGGGVAVRADACSAFLCSSHSAALHDAPAQGDACIFTTAT